MPKNSIFFFVLFFQCSYPLVSFAQKEERLKIAAEMEKSIQTELLNKWYPQSVDSQYGGFLSTFTYDFKPTGAQDKMIVTQARHTWSNSKASLLYTNINHYKTSAAHGFTFLKYVLWSKNYSRC